VDDRVEFGDLLLDCGPQDWVGSARGTLQVLAVDEWPADDVFAQVVADAFAFGESLQFGVVGAGLAQVQGEAGVRGDSG
jgi:hypothetical protein